MSTTQQPEVWLRGALPGIIPYIQPVAHALLQANEEIKTLLQDFPEHLLWKKPAGLASPGFHLQHMTGVLDRLFTYAEGKQLIEDQLVYLKAEGSPASDLLGLAAALNRQIELSVNRLKEIKEDNLVEAREVGRAKLPSTVLGLLVHAAEHTMRHTGQLLVTVTVLKAGNDRLR